MSFFRYRLVVEESPGVWGTYGVGDEIPGMVDALSAWIDTRIMLGSHADRWKILSMPDGKPVMGGQGKW